MRCSKDIKHTQVYNDIFFYFSVPPPYAPPPPPITSSTSSINKLLGSLKVKAGLDKKNPNPVDL